MDILKHKMVFDPTPLNQAGHRTAVIGLGAVGSVVAMHLAKLGLQRMVLFDDDKVEPHNLANQLFYSKADIGFLKTSCLAERIADLTDTNPGIIEERIGKRGTGTRQLQYDYVFCCVDSMASRQDIFEEHVFMNGKTSFFSDGRMAAREWRAYGFSPTKLAHVNSYRKEWYPDADVDIEHTATCQITPSIAATAGTVANAMIWQFMAHVAGKTVRNVICGCTEPWVTLISASFDA